MPNAQTAYPSAASRTGRLTRRALLLAPLATQARAQCAPRAIVALRIVEGFPVLAATIGDTPVSFLLDTGAQAHLVLPEAQAALRLQVLPGSVPLFGTGGERSAAIVLLAGVRLGPIALDPAATPVAPLPAIPHVTPMLAGLLGAPLLTRFDLDLDATAGRLGLYEAGTCFPAGSGDTIPLLITPEREALLPVRINGVTLTALLDTGSRATLLSLAAARNLGLDAPISANSASGIDGEALPVAHLRVREMAVGDDVLRNAPISIAPVQLGRADMLLGLDYLRQRRVWISFVTARLVIGVPSPAPSGR